MKTIITIRIDSALVERLRTIAAKDDRTVSYLIRKAIELYLKQHGS